MLVLLNPSITKESIINQKAKLSILVDNSSSITFFKKDSLVHAILQNFKTHKKLNKRFDINYYSFGNLFQQSDSFSFDENQTDISMPLERISKIQKNASNAIVLLSDGNQTIGNDYQYTSIKDPVFPVVIGDTTKYQDVKIAQINVNRYSFINNQFPVESILQYEGTQTIKLRYSLENNGKIIFSERINFSEKNNSHILKTFIKASKEGTNFFTSKIEYLENEKNVVNNSKNFSVEVIDKQSEILIVSSFYHPDLGALKKAIESDKQRKVTIRIVDNKNIQLNNYQLVVLYQPNNKFNIIIDQLNSNKSSFMLITGSKTDWLFLNNKSLGINKKNINQLENYSARFYNGFLNFSQKNIGFENLPPMIDYYGETTVSIPHQTLLYQSINGFSSQNPLLATANHNNQKKVFLFGEGLWKWRSSSFLKNDSFQYFDEFIGNLVQYASNKKIRNRLDLDINSFYNANSSIQIGAFYVDENYQFDDRATILFTIKNKNSKKKQTFPFSLSGSSYQLELTSLEAGEYEYTIEVDGRNISKKGTFKVNEFLVEEQFTNANSYKLELLAQKTAGKLYFEDKYRLVIDDLTNDTRFSTIQKSKKTIDKLVNWQWLMLLIIGLLSLEWFIRKYIGKI
ncbi:VWA domain-containing protein [Flavobacteriaceae bacterium]|nr:VWA domain-containing protein [Flavobacteriaceae bacterium]